MLCQLIFVVYRYIYYPENVCISYNYVLYIYITGVLLKYNHFWLDITKAKHEINLRHSADSMSSKQNIVMVKIIFFDKVFNYNNNPI